MRKIIFILCILIIAASSVVVYTKVTGTPEPLVSELCATVQLDKVSIVTETSERIVFTYWSDDPWYEVLDPSLCDLLVEFSE